MENSDHTGRAGGNLEIDKSGYGTTTEIVHFDDTVKPREVVDKTHVTMPDVYLEETLKGWLSRVYTLDVVSWSPSSAIGDQLGWYEFPASLFNMQSLYDKIKNIHYFRANVRVSIRMNGTRMHYGKLLVTTSPYPTYDLAHYSLTNNIYSASGYPFTIISPTENEPVEILVPFISPLMYSTINPAHYELPSYERYNWGGVGIYVLNPLNTVGGSTSVSFTVFAAFEDISFAGYTATSQPKPAKPVAPPFIKAAHPIMNNKRYEAQAKTVEEAEASAKGKAGIVTRTLEKVTAISGALSLIPEISPIAATVEGVSSALTPVARYFGWCKPDNVCVQHPVGIKYADFCHSAGVDNSVKLALYPDNSVQPAANILGNRPEMDFSYILAQPMLIAILEWKPDGERKVFSIPVTPLTRRGGEGIVFPTFNSHVAEAFHYWRGDMRYYFSITSSAFHSGRLRIVWSPDESDEPQSYEDGSNVISKVVDIQTETEFGIVVPYLSSKPYQSTHYRPTDANEETRKSQSTGANGRLTVMVLNALTSTVEPVPSVYINVFASSTNMKFGYPKKVGFKYQAQGLTREEMANGPYYPIVPAKSYEIQGYCFGEDVTNIKQLTNRPTPTQTYYIAKPEPAGPKLRDDPLRTSSYVAVAVGDDGLISSAFNNGGVITNLPPGHWYYNIVYTGRATAISLTSLTQDNQIFSTLPSSTDADSLNPEVDQARITGYVLTDEPYSGILLSASPQGTPTYVSATFSPAPGDISLNVPEIPEFPNWPPSIDLPDLPRWDERNFVPVEIESSISGNYSLNVASFATYFLSMYRFWRGSLRYKLLEMASQSVSTRAVFLKNRASPYDEYLPDPHRGTMAVREPVSNVVEVTVPYYYNTFCKITNFKSSTHERRIDDEIVPVFTFVNNSRFGQSAAGVISLSTGDDFEYYFLVAPPARLLVE